jgi:predicted nucleotidyltransferase
VNLRPEDSNLAQPVAAATKLEPLLDQIAFVGGCVPGLLLTDRAAAPMRPTLDVDAIVAIASYAEFTMLEKRLRELGSRRCRLAELSPRRVPNLIIES